jgi:hypothetical protein
MRVFLAAILATALPSATLAQAAPAGQIEDRLRNSPRLQLSTAELVRAEPVTTYKAATTDGEIEAWRRTAPPAQAAPAAPADEPSSQRVHGQLDATVGSSGYRDIQAAVGKNDGVHVAFSEGDAGPRQIKAGWGSLALGLLLPR